MTTTKYVGVALYVQCKSCDGKGWFRNGFGKERGCDVCGGDGSVIRRHTLGELAELLRDHEQQRGAR